MISCCRLQIAQEVKRNIGPYFNATSPNAGVLAKGVHMSVVQFGSFLPNSCGESNYPESKPSWRLQTMMSFVVSVWYGERSPPAASSTNLFHCAFWTCTVVALFAVFAAAHSHFSEDLNSMEGHLDASGDAQVRESTESVHSHEDALDAVSGQHEDGGDHR